MDYYLEEVLLSVILFFATVFMVLILKAQSDKRKVDRAFKELDEVYTNFINTASTKKINNVLTTGLKSKIVEYCVFSDYPFHFCVKQYDGYITVTFKTFLVKRTGKYHTPYCPSL